MTAKPHNRRIYILNAFKRALIWVSCPFLCDLSFVCFQWCVDTQTMTSNCWYINRGNEFMTTHKTEFTVFPHVFTEALNQRKSVNQPRFMTAQDQTETMAKMCQNLLRYPSCHTDPAVSSPFSLWSVFVCLMFLNPVSAWQKYIYNCCVLLSLWCSCCPPKRGKKEKFSVEIFQDNC